MTEATAPFTPEQDAISDGKNRVWKKFRHHRSAMLGGVLVAFFVIIALAAPIPSWLRWNAIVYMKVAGRSDE